MKKTTTQNQRSAAVISSGLKKFSREITDERSNAYMAASFHTEKPVSLNETILIERRYSFDDNGGGYQGL